MGEMSASKIYWRGNVLLHRKLTGRKCLGGGGNVHDSKNGKHSITRSQTLK